MKQSELWLVEFDPTVGAEIGKTRPCIIVSRDSIGRLPLKIVVPITDWKDHFHEMPWMVQLFPSNQNGLTKQSSADCFPVKSVSQMRFRKKLGKISSQDFSTIQNTLIEMLA